MANKPNVPAPQHYIKQPYPLSSLASDLSLMQTHILVEMMDSVSSKVGEMFDHGDSRLLFKEEDFKDGVAHIDVDFRTLTNRPDSYRDVETVALKMMKAQMEYTEENEDGPTKVVINAFESVEIPMEGNRRKGTIRFNLTKREASSLFNFTRYSKYLKNVARNTNSVYTARIYMLITAWRKFGVWNADYQELRKSLGCNAYNKSTSQWEQKKYAEYRQFKRRVLKTAEEELKQLAEKGVVDCYFDFKEVYPGGRVIAQPDKICFTIYTTELGRLEDKRQSEVHHFYELQSEMQNLFSLTERECKQILQKVDEDMVEQFTIRVREIAHSMKVQGDKIKDRKAYAFKCLNEAVLEFTPAMDELHEQPQASSSMQSSKRACAENPQQSAAPAATSITADEQEKWTSLASQLSAGSSSMKMVLEGITLSKDKDGLYLSVPTKVFAETFKTQLSTIASKSKLRIKVK